MAENAEQKRLFTEALQQQCGDEDKERTQFLTERKYEQVCAGLEEFYEAGDASAKKAVQKVHSQVYAWANKYELVSFKDSSANATPAATRATRSAATTTELQSANFGPGQPCTRGW